MACVGQARWLTRAVSVVGLWLRVTIALSISQKIRATVVRHSGALHDPCAQSHRSPATHAYECLFQSPVKR